MSIARHCAEYYFTVLIFSALGFARERLRLATTHGEMQSVLLVAMCATATCSLPSATARCEKVSAKRMCGMNRIAGRTWFAVSLAFAGCRLSRCGRERRPRRQYAAARCNGMHSTSNFCNSGSEEFATRQQTLPWHRVVAKKMAEPTVTGAQSKHICAARCRICFLTKSSRMAAADRCLFQSPLLNRGQDTESSACRCHTGHEPISSGHDAAKIRSLLCSQSGDDRATTFSTCRFLPSRHE